MISILPLRSDEEKIFRAFAEIPGWNASEALIHQIGGGLTNKNYKVSFDSKSYFVRCSMGQNELLGISLEREWICTQISSKHGLAPAAVLFSPVENILITDFIETHGKKVDLRQPETLRKFCAQVKSLHRLKAEFPMRFSPFDTIQSYLSNALNKNADIPPIFFEEVLPHVQRLQKSIGECARKVPCHLDLHSGNALDDGNRIWLIDWEYAAMGDPFFDLATCASQENFSDQEMAELLATYLDNKPQQKELDYFLSMRVLVDVRWALWCYLQAQISPLNAPFKQFGDLFLYEALKRIIRI